MTDKYGADALRMALVWGANVDNDISLSEDNVKGMRNLANKIWNAGRFVESAKLNAQPSAHKIENELKKIIKEATDHLDKFKLNLAAELIYDKFWHWYCDEVIEMAKAGKISQEDLKQGLKVFLKLLHPFMPFVTEAIWRELGLPGQLILQSWPR